MTRTPVLQPCRLQAAHPASELAYPHTTCLTHGFGPSMQTGHVDALHHCGHLCNGRWEMADVRTVLKGRCSGDAWHAVSPRRGRVLDPILVEAARGERLVLRMRRSVRAASACCSSGQPTRACVRRGARRVHGWSAFAAVCCESGRSESANKATTCDLMAWVRNHAQESTRVISTPFCEFHTSRENHGQIHDFLPLQKV